MREGAPDAVDFASERVTMADQGRDVEQRALDVRHMHAEGININRGNMQFLLVVDLLLSQGLRQCYNHCTGANTGFVCAHEFLLLDQMLGVMHEHLCHGLTHRVRREKLACLVILDFETVIQFAEYIGGLVLQTQDEHAEEGRELLELFGLVLLDDGEVLLFSDSFVDGIGYVAEGNGGELNEVAENGEGVMAVGELLDGVFESGQRVMNRLRWWLGAELVMHRLSFVKGQAHVPASTKSSLQERKEPLSSVVRER
jgi:hypothetical protein